MVKKFSGRAMRLQSLWSLPQLFLSSPGPTRAGVPCLVGHSLPLIYLPLPKYLFTASHSSASKKWKENKPICNSSVWTSGLGFCQNRSHITTNLKIMTKNRVQLLTQASHKAQSQPQDEYYTSAPLSEKVTTCLENPTCCSPEPLRLLSTFIVLALCILMQIPHHYMTSKTYA